MVDSPPPMSPYTARRRELSQSDLQASFSAHSRYVSLARPPLATKEYRVCLQADDIRETHQFHCINIVG